MYFNGSVQTLYAALRGAVFLVFSLASLVRLRALWITLSVYFIVL